MLINLSVDIQHYLLILKIRDKGRDLTQSYDKSPFTYRKKKPKSNVTTYKTTPNPSITQRFQTDLGQLIGVTAVTPLVWLNRYTRPKQRVSKNFPDNPRTKCMFGTYNIAIWRFQVMKNSYNRRCPRLQNASKHHI